MKRISTSATALAAVMLAAAPAHAQNAASDSQEGIADIVVTAEKRSTNVQDVPIAITALGADELARANVIGTRGLSGLAPNVNIGQDARGVIVSIRGVSSANVTFSRDPSVAFHVDGVYMSRPTGATGTFYDLDRVEILRGPQGTLYGRNSTGGTVNVITAKPTYEFGGNVSASYGNYDAVQLQGMLNVPIVDDKVAFRIAGIHSKHDGYTRNRFPGGVSLDDQDDQAIRATLLLEPTDNLKIVLGGDYLWQGGGGQAIVQFPDATPRSVALNAPGGQRNRLYGARAEVTLSLPTFDIVSLTAMRRDNQHWIYDGDGNATTTTSVLIANKGEQFSQEVRFVSTDDGPFKWIAGGFFLREENADQGTALYDTALTTGNAQIRWGRVSKSKSLFGQFDYTLFDRLTLTAGARYTWDDKKAPNGINALFDATGYTTPNTYVAPVPFHGEQYTWRLGAKYDLNTRNNIYANVARGYKAGGFNSPPFTTYDPELITSYEIGTKNRFAGNTIQLNASAFYYDYTDFQINSAVTINNALRTLISNAGAATVKGIEIESVFQPIPALRIDGSIGYLSTKFDSLKEAYDAVSRTRVDLTGNRLPRAPEWTWRVGMRYDAAIGSGTLSPNISLQGQSGQFFSEFNDRVITVGATTITNYVRMREKGWVMANASLRYEARDARWFIEAFGQNLFDKTVIVTASLNLSNQPSGSYAPPRTYGVRVGTKF
jgi:iron complex outermembrane receptor protein